MKKELLSEALEGAWHCQPLGFILLAFRTVREYISVVLSHPVYGTLLWQLQEMDTAAAMWIHDDE